MGFLDGREGENPGEGRAGMEEQRNRTFPSVLLRDSPVFQPGTGGIPSHGSKSQPLCLSTETSLGML